MALTERSTFGGRFCDVARADEAAEELGGLAGFLGDTERYIAAAANLPHGYLLVGLPGMGKTLLARAVVGDAGVPFFAMAAAELVETHVGVGAARVRRLFDRARAVIERIVLALLHEETLDTTTLVGLAGREHPADASGASVSATNGAG